MEFVAETGHPMLSCHGVKLEAFAKHLPRTAEDIAARGPWLESRIDAKTKHLAEREHAMLSDICLSDKCEIRGSARLAGKGNASAMCAELCLGIGHVSCFRRRDIGMAFRSPLAKTVELVLCSGPKKGFRVFVPDIANLG